MALTKVTYSMIKGAKVNVFDFMTAAQIASVQARDGAEDVSAPIQAAIDSMETTVTDPFNGQITVLSGTLYMPDGDYYIQTPIVIQDGYGLTIEGAGVGATAIFWDTDDNTEIAIQFSDCRQSALQNMTVIANENVDKLIQFYNNAATANNTSTANTLQDVTVAGNFKTYACVLVGGGLDANNDFMQFVRVQTQGYSHSGFFLQGFQSHQNHFIDCGIQGLDATQTTQNGLYGVFSQKQSPSNAAASFIWERGGGGGHAAADFYQGGATSLGCHIYWGNSENTYRFFETDTTISGDTTPINIIGCRVESNMVAPDGKIINIGMSGPVVIEGCNIGTGGSPSSVFPKIYIEDNRQMVINVSNNRFPFAHIASGTSSYDYSSLELAAVSNIEYAQVQFANNVFINAVDTQPSTFYSSVGQSTVPVYFGYGPYRFNNASPQNVSTLTPAHPWQKVLLYVNDGNTTFTSAGNIALKNKTMPYTPGAAAQLELIYNPWTSKWTETNAQT
jgi:hypothetical protein